MNINQAGISLIKSFESCRLKAYKDSKGIPTIGWGATYYQNGSRVKMGDTITQQQADELFAWHIEQFSKGVIGVIKSQINDNQFSALVSFTFNLGIGNLKSSTLLKKVNINPEDPTIRDEFMKWVNKGSAFEKGLTRRRKAEADLYYAR